MSNSNPWAEIATPYSSSSISTRRIDPEMPWNCYWGKDTHDRCLFVMRHQGDSAPVGKLPELRGLTCNLLPVGSTGEQNFVLTLLENSQSDLFYSLCMDLVDCARTQTTEPDAVRQVVARAWRWHHLLRSGQSKRLGPEEQKGLIAELNVLGTFLFEGIGIQDAIGSWIGPTGAPKDFDVGGVPLEVKARRGTATPFVAISSEHQLDMPEAIPMYLYVGEISRATDFSDEWFTLTDVVSDVRARILNQDTSALFDFEKTLAGTGFRDEDDYSEDRWIGGPSRWFEVRDGFPRLRAAGCPEGVSEVRYRIALNSCSDFEISVDVVRQALGVDHGLD